MKEERGRQVAGRVEVGISISLQTDNTFGQSFPFSEHNWKRSLGRNKFATAKGNEGSGAAKGIRGLACPLKVEDAFARNCFTVIAKVLSRQRSGFAVAFIILYFATGNGPLEDNRNYTHVSKWNNRYQATRNFNSPTIPHPDFIFAGYPPNFGSGLRALLVP